MSVDTHQFQKLPPGYVDDVSRMNKTKVSEVWDVPGDGLAAEEQLRCGGGHRSSLSNPPSYEQSSGPSNNRSPLL